MGRPIGSRNKFRLLTRRRREVLEAFEAAKRAGYIPTLMRIGRQVGMDRRDVRRVRNDLRSMGHAV